MIIKLTKKQESKIPVYLNKWLKQGYRTKTIDRKKAKAAVSWFYTDILKIDKPKYVIFLDSPMACQLACNLIKNTKWDSQLDSQLYSQLDSQLGSQLDSQLNSQLSSQLYSQLDSQLRSQLDSQLRSQLSSQLSSQLYSQLSSQLDSQLSSMKKEYFYNSNFNWYWAGYYGFYEYVLNELLPKKRKDFKLFTQYLNHSKEIHYMFPFKDIVFLPDFPKTITVNGRGQLNSQDKPALLYRDTYALYSSNGVRVTKEFCETKPQNFTKDQILKETNADVRREIIRKVGIDRVATLLDFKVIDKHESYELITFDIGDGRIRPYLKMVNPSIGVTHIEGVRPEITTVKDAIAYRNGLAEYSKPKELS